jgi:heme-degrading monooxygenase HmoA
MHAVVVRVNIGDVEASRKEMHVKVVPGASEAPGFVSGYWTRSDDGSNRLSMIVFDSEDAARAAAEGMPSRVPETVTLESVEVREVVEHA